MSVQIELAILSRQGGRSYNEDACGHWHSDSNLCCVVADGAGGHGGGDKASRLAVQSIIGSYSAAPQASAESVREMILQSSRSVIEHRADGAAQQNMHSTVVALFVDLDHNTAAWGHCGDSRLYAFRAGVMVLQTRDHSLVQSLVDGGLLAADQAHNHPQRSELLSALGVAEDQLLIGVSAEPWALQAGDVFLLCTDGLWEYVAVTAIEAALAQAPDPQAWLDDLEQQVLAAAAHKPNHDNFSALTVWVSEH